LYSKPVYLNRGVDNRVEFKVLNQQQKPVDLTGSTLVFRILNPTGTEILLESQMTNDLPLTGIASVNLVANDLMSITEQKCIYTLEIITTTNSYALNIDQNPGARGDLFINDSIFPAFVPSQYVTIPSGQIFPNTLPLQHNTLAVVQPYYSSNISPPEQPLTTFQATYDNFYGNVVIQGTSTINGEWYNILEQDYAYVTDTFSYNVPGFHPYIRMEFTSNVGTVTNILYR